MLEKGFKRGIEFQKKKDNSISEMEALRKLKTEVRRLFKNIDLLDLIIICDLKTVKGVKTRKQAEELSSNRCPFSGSCPALDNIECQKCIELYFGINGED